MMFHILLGRVTDFQDLQTLYHCLSAEENTLTMGDVDALLGVCEKYADGDAEWLKGVVGIDLITCGGVPEAIVSDKVLSDKDIAAINLLKQIIAEGRFSKELADDIVSYITKPDTNPLIKWVLERALLDVLVSINNSVEFENQIKTLASSLIKYTNAETELGASTLERVRFLWR